MNEKKPEPVWSYVCDGSEEPRIVDVASLEHHRQIERFPFGVDPSKVVTSVAFDDGLAIAGK